MSFVLEGDNNESFAAALQPVLTSSSAREMIKSDFLVTGFTIADFPLPQFQSLVNLKISGQATKACLYFIVVSHEFEVKLLKRIDLNGGATSSQAIYNFLQDSKTLFDIIAQEDPAYAQVELL